MQAASGYLDEHDWDHLGEYWLEQVLADTAQPCKGARGPLTRIRPHLGHSSIAGGQPCYRLAAYLDQTGRTERAAVFPPAEFWNAVVATVDDRDVLSGIGRAEERRGRYHRAAQLYQQADHGHLGAPIFLAELRDQAQERTRAGDLTAAEALVARAADYGDDEAPLTFGGLAMGQERTGGRADTETLVLNAADRGDAIALLIPVILREGAGEQDGAEGLAMCAADHGHTGALSVFGLTRWALPRRGRCPDDDGNR